MIPLKRLVFKETLVFVASLLLPPTFCMFQYQGYLATHRINRLDKNTILGITMSVGVGIAFLLAMVLWNQSRRQVTEQGVADKMDFDMPHRLSDALGYNLVLLFQNHCRKDLAIADLLKATGNF